MSLCKTTGCSGNSQAGKSFENYNSNTAHMSFFASKAAVIPAFNIM